MTAEEKEKFARAHEKYAPIVTEILSTCKPELLLILKTNGMSSLINTSCSPYFQIRFGEKSSTRIEKQRKPIPYQLGLLPTSSFRKYRIHRKEEHNL